MKNLSNNAKKIAATYNRLAKTYDRMLGPLENDARIQEARRYICNSAKGNVLEVGIGTGINIPLYPTDCNITGIDLSEKMLEKAQIQAGKHHRNIELIQADVENIPFPDDNFDTVISTFTFCLVPNPVRGLNELCRVCKSSGSILLLEHVISHKSIVALLQNLFNPITVALLRDHINRDTTSLARNAGLQILQEKLVLGDIVKLIEGRPKPAKA